MTGFFAQLRQASDRNEKDGSIILTVLKRLSHILLITLAIFLGVCPVGAADEEGEDSSEAVEQIKKVTINADMNGHKTMNFFGKAANKGSLVPEGSTGDVIEVRKLGSGSYGVRVKLTNIGGNKGPNTAKVNDETWVYYSQKDPAIGFPGKDGTEMQDPEQALIDKSKEADAQLPLPPGAVKRVDLPGKDEVLRTSVKDDDKDDPEASAQEAKTAEPAAKPSKPKAAKSADPNLAHKKDPKKTEADADCAPCREAQKKAGEANKNHKDIKQVAEKISPPGKREKSDPNNKWANDPVVSRYSNSKRTQKMIRYALRNKRGHSLGKCYKFVKRALVASDQVRHYPPGVYARNAVKDLKAQGMINMLDNPKYRAMIKKPGDAPKGAILVYWNGTREAGDIQIKLDNGPNSKFVSDFENRSFLESPKAHRYAKMGKPYKIIGVMIQP